MSDYTSSPSRPASPVGPLPDLSTPRPPAYRFNWDLAARRPGPGSVSETTEGRGDYFATTPRVDIYGASTSTANVAQGLVPSQWSSAKHGFHAISTVVNNPHKKSAPPKAHAAVPPAPHADLPRVRRKDFDPYLTAVGPEWEAFQRNTELGRAGAAQLGDSSVADYDNPPETPRTPRLPKNLPPLSSIPEVFFKPDFNLGDPRTFDAVAETPSASSSALSSTSSSSPTTPTDPSTLAHALPLLEKLSHHADTLEQHLVHEIARRATPFFAALANLQDLQAESARCLARVQTLRAQLSAVGEQGARRGLHGGQREARLAHLRQVRAGVAQVQGVVGTVRSVRARADAGQWGAALDGVDALRALWDGQAPAPSANHAPSPDTPLPSVAEEEEAEKPPDTAPLAFPLSRLRAFSALPTQLQTLALEIAGALIADAVSVLKVDLVARIHGSSEGQPDVRERLKPLVQGLVRTKNLRGGIAEWRRVALDEVQGIVQQHIPSFDPDDDPQKETADSSWISSVRLVSHQEFQTVLRSTLKSFLNCIEGLQGMNGCITDVIEDIRPPALPSELTALHDSLFDILSSSAESANMLTSKVISARAEQHVKLELREFIEMFNECWSFVVRCEVICRRMIVGLRGVVVSQAKSFLQAFHQSHINQSAKLVEDEQWSQAEVPATLQRVINLILDAAVHDPREFVLKVETAVAAPPSPLPTSSTLRAPSSPLLSPGSGSRPSSPRPSSPRLSPQANGTSPPHAKKHLRIEERSYFTVPATQETLLLLTDYLKVIVNLSLLTTDTVSRVIEFLKSFNSRTCQVVLGAGAMRSAGLKNITAKHLALASQSLSIVIALVPYVRETFRRHLSPKQAVMLVEFDKLKRDYQEHQNEIHAKLVAIMGDRLAAHIKSLNAIRWDAPPPKPGVHDYMELLVKETVTLHKVLSRYLATGVVELVMSQVFAAINHRLSEEYTKIELPTPEAKERLLADTRYLHEKFSVLKTAGAPTALLETLVADKRVMSAPPVSPRPTTPTPAHTPASPLPLPPGDVPLNSPRAGVQPPTKRPSLFTNERIKGMLSRGGGGAHASTTASPVDEKEKEKERARQGLGFKQLASPQPSPQPEKQHHQQPEQATTPVPAPNGAPAEKPSSEVPQAGADGAQASNGEVEHPPSTPPKDEAQVAEPGPEPEPEPEPVAPEGASVAA